MEYRENCAHFENCANLAEMRMRRVFGRRTRRNKKGSGT
jgi:hypothetical protein